MYFCIFPMVLIVWPKYLVYYQEKETLLVATCSGKTERFCRLLNDSNALLDIAVAALIVVFVCFINFVVTLAFKISWSNQRNDSSTESSSSSLNTPTPTSLNLYSGNDARPASTPRLNDREMETTELISKYESIKQQCFSSLF